MVVLAVISGLVPLVGVLGYELALWAAVAASFSGLDLGAACARHAMRRAAGASAVVSGAVIPSTAGARGASAVGHVASVAGRAVLATWLPLALWAAIGALRGLWMPTCDWWFGVTTFAAMPLASGALAAGMGVAIGLAVGPRPILGTLAPLAAALAVIAAAVARGYSAPPVFSYSPLWGYFPGNLYDEQIELSAALGWARLETLAWVLGALSLAAAGLDRQAGRWRLAALVGAGRPRRARVLALGCAGLTLAAASWLHLQSGALGYRPEAEDLQRALGGRKETAHFVIHHAQTPAVLRDLELIAEDHEFRLAQVVTTLGVAPGGKIHSYYFADDDEKARWMGARHVEMAKPWRRELYLSHAAFPHPSLRHEIAHAVAAEFGDPWFRVSARRIAGLPLLVNPGLIEGLAVAADWPGSQAALTPHQAAHAMQKLGYQPSIEALLSLRFLAVSSARGYTTAGSFIRFLLDTHGAAALRELYRSGGDFPRAYGKPLAELEASWLAMISSLPMAKDEVEAVRERFRQVAVFDRPCPHAVASRRARAFAAAREGELPRAVALLRQVCGDSPMEPRFRLELADLLARGGEAHQREAAELWRELGESKSVTSALRADALERLASVAGASGSWDQAGNLLDRALALALGDDDRRQLEAMQLALRHGGPAGPALRSYFFAPLTAAPAPLLWAGRAVAAEPTLGLAWYLRGLRQAEVFAWHQMTEDLARAMQRGLPSLRFTRNAARRMAVAALRSRDAGRLLQAIEVLEGPQMSQTDHLLAADFRARLAFASTGKVADGPRSHAGEK